MRRVAKMYINQNDYTIEERDELYAEYKDLHKKALINHCNVNIRSEIIKVEEIFKHLKNMSGHSARKMLRIIAGV